MIQNHPLSQAFTELMPDVKRKVPGFYDGLLDFLAEVALSSLLHVLENHGGDFFGLEDLSFTLVLDFDDGLATTRDDLEGPVLHVGLDGSVGELAADQALGVEDGVEGVEGDLVLGGVTDEAFGVGESDVRWRRTVALIV